MIEAKEKKECKTHCWHKLSERIGNDGCTYLVASRCCLCGVVQESTRLMNHGPYRPAAEQI